MILGLFQRLSAIATDVIASDAVAARWDQPSAVEGYTIGGLAGHLARAVLTVERYLAASAPASDAEPADPAGYFVAVLADHDPVVSEVHAAVRARAVETAASGPDELAKQVSAAADHVVRQLDEPPAMQQPVEVLDGIVLSIEDYLATRIVELAIHLDDLAVSIGQQDLTTVPDDAYRLVAGVLGQIAAARAGGLATVRSLARRERHPDAVRAL